MLYGAVKIEKLYSYSPDVWLLKPSQALRDRVFYELDVVIHEENCLRQAVLLYKIVVVLGEIVEVKRLHRDV